MAKIFIDPGHGGTDPGAVGNGLQEKNLTLSISKKIRDKLANYENVQIKLSREGDQTLSLKQRTDMANAWGADYVVSVHINSAGGTNGEGFESFVYNGSVKPQSIVNQNVIHPEIVQLTRFKDRGKKRANLHMVRASNAASILTESGFINNPSDAAKLKQVSFLDKIAQGHVDGLVRAFGLKLKSDSSSESTAPNPTPVKVEAEVQSVSTEKPTANLVVDGYWGPATTRELQKYLGTTVDGVISGQYNNSVTRQIPSVKFGPPFTGSNVIRTLQKCIGAKADGFIGPETVRKLQRNFDTPADGVISKPSLMVKELQRRLNNRKL